LVAREVPEPRIDTSEVRAFDVLAKFTPGELPRSCWALARPPWSRMSSALSAVAATGTSRSRSSRLRAVTRISSSSVVEPDAVWA